MRESMLSGYRHHSYLMERKLSEYFLRGKGDSRLASTLTLETYMDVLAPNRLRAMKNGLICFVAVISRTAIQNGVEGEVSFALSDYYVNAVEESESSAQLQELLVEMQEFYRDLVQEATGRTYSLPVSRAIQFVQRQVYEPCRVSEVALYIGLNPQYFATLFKKEVGMEPSAYIRQCKMKEAKEILMQMRHPVAQIAEELGYCSASHFIAQFRSYYGITPKQMLKKGV